MKNICLLVLLTLIMLIGNGCCGLVSHHSYYSRDIYGHVESYDYTVGGPTYVEYGTAPAVIYAYPRSGWYGGYYYHSVPTYDIWIGGRAPRYNYHQPKSYSYPNQRCDPRSDNYRGNYHQGR